MLTSGVVNKFWYGLYNESYYGECVKYLAVKSGEHIRFSPLPNKRVQSRKNSAICYPILSWNYSTTIEGFSALCYENYKHHLELNESLLIMRH